MNIDEKLRQELVNFLDSAHTHTPLREAVANFPPEFINQKPDQVPYTFYGLLEHIRIAQVDMVDFIQDADYKELRWPEDYWPDNKLIATEEMWDHTITQIEKNLKILKDIVKDPKFDLLAKIPHGHGQTIFKEVIQVIDHASYHIGEFILMRRTMGIWKSSAE